MDKNLNLDVAFGDKETLVEIRKRLDTKLDNLVYKLTKLDYRDFLVVNKYILESRNSKDYHIYARGQVLAAAVKK